MAKSTLKHARGKKPLGRPKLPKLPDPPDPSQNVTIKGPNTCVAQAEVGSNDGSTQNAIDLFGNNTNTGSSWIPFVWDSTNTFDSGEIAVNFTADCSTSTPQATWNVGNAAQRANAFSGSSIKSVIVVAGVQNYAMARWTSLQVTYYSGTTADDSDYPTPPSVDTRDFSDPAEMFVEVDAPAGRTKVVVTGTIRFEYNPDDIGVPGPSDLFVQVALNT